MYYITSKQFFSVQYFRTDLTQYNDGVDLFITYCMDFMVSCKAEKGCAFHFMLNKDFHMTFMSERMAV